VKGWEEREGSANVFLSFNGFGCYRIPVSTFTEVADALRHLSSSELADLEELVQRARQDQKGIRKASLKNIRPTSVGKLLKPIGSRSEWYDELRESGE
jgi:hypothetical protein